jgi:hypothetical protein
VELILYHYLQVTVVFAVTLDSTLKVIYLLLPIVDRAAKATTTLLLVVSAMNVQQENSVPVPRLSIAKTATQEQHQTPLETHSAPSANLDTTKTTQDRKIANYVILVTTAIKMALKRVYHVQLVLSIM